MGKVCNVIQTLLSSSHFGCQSALIPCRLQQLIEHDMQERLVFFVEVAKRDEVIKENPGERDACRIDECW